MAIHLKPFDPDREFVTAAAFRANGTIWGRGRLFDKSSINKKTLRILYERRKIIYDDDPKAIRLLSRAGGPGEAALAPGSGLLMPVSSPADEPSPVIDTSEDDSISKLKARYSKTDLLNMAKDIPGVQRSMTKEELSRALIRSGYGIS